MTFYRDGETKFGTWVLAPAASDEGSLSFGLRPTRIETNFYFLTREQAEELRDALNAWLVQQ